VESTLKGAECSRRVREARGDEKPAMIATDIGQLLKESGCDRIFILGIKLHSDECAVAFQKAITTEPFVLSSCEELVVCKRFAN
jgi:hypothetical protein